MSTIPAQLQYLGDRALSTARTPGATPGQFGEAVRSPGYPSSPVTDFKISSTSMSSTSFGSRCVTAQYDVFITLRGDNGDSSETSWSAMRCMNSGLTVPPPEPA